MHRRDFQRFGRQKVAANVAVRVISRGRGLPSTRYTSSTLPLEERQLTWAVECLKRLLRLAFTRVGGCLEGRDEPESMAVPSGLRTSVSLGPGFQGVSRLFSQCWQVVQCRTTKKPEIESNPMKANIGSLVGSRFHIENRLLPPLILRRSSVHLHPHHRGQGRPVQIRHRTRCLAP